MTMENPCRPDHPDCTAFLAEVYLYLDSECDESRRAQLQAHMDECPGCLQKYGVERAVKDLVGRCCGGERAPEDLRAKVRGKIRDAVRVQSTEMFATDGSSYIHTRATRIQVTRGVDDEQNR